MVEPAKFVVDEINISDAVKKFMSDTNKSLEFENSTKDIVIVGALLEGMRDKISYLENRLKELEAKTSDQKESINYTKDNLFDAFEGGGIVVNNGWITEKDTKETYPNLFLGDILELCQQLDDKTGNITNTPSPPMFGTSPDFVVGQRYFVIKVYNDKSHFRVCDQDGYECFPDLVWTPSAWKLVGFVPSVLFDYINHRDCESMPRAEYFMQFAEQETDGIIT